MNNKNVEKNDGGFDLKSIKSLKNGFLNLKKSERNRVDKKINTFSDRMKTALKIGIPFVLVLGGLYLGAMKSAPEIPGFEPGNNAENKNTNKDTEKGVNEVLEEKGYKSDTKSKTGGSTKTTPDISDDVTSTRKDKDEQIQMDTDTPQHFQNENNKAYENEINKRVEESKGNGAKTDSIDVEGKDVSGVVETKPQPEPERTEEKVDIDKENSKNAQANKDDKAPEQKDEYHDVVQADDNSLEAMLKSTQKSIDDDEPTR